MTQKLLFVVSCFIALGASSCSKDTAPPAANPIAQNQPPAPGPGPNPGPSPIPGPKVLSVDEIVASVEKLDGTEDDECRARIVEIISENQLRAVKPTLAVPKASIQQPPPMYVVAELDAKLSIQLGGTEDRKCVIKRKI